MELLQTFENYKRFSQLKYLLDWNFGGKTSRPTSESSSKELNLGCKLNQTWTRPDLDLT